MITQTQAPQREIAVSEGSDLLAAVRALAWPLGITALVLLGALLGPAALNNPVTGATPTGARLEVGGGYMVFAPLFNVLDTLSVLTLGQHFAVLVTLILLYGLWRLFRTRSRRGWLQRIAVELGVAALALAGLLAFYGYGIVGPRPMAQLVVADEDLLILDVHSHTEASHDGRPGFDAERNRAWHEAAGFHAVYVSDHRTWDGYAEGAEANPIRAGDGTVLLPALEIKYAGKYASALGPAWRYRHAMNGNILEPDSLYRSLREGQARPTLILTIPSGLDGVVADTRDSIGYVAVEVSDASPRGLRQSRRDRDIILALADSLNLATVAASNNHGWGRTTAAWTVMRIPGWRGLTPAQLNRAIEDRLHRERRDAARVIERRVPFAGSSPTALAGTVPAIIWQMFGGMGAGERVSWLVWAWGLTLLFLLRPGRRQPA